jgi:hypothetical protein
VPSMEGPEGDCSRARPLVSASGLRREGHREPPCSYGVLNSASSGVSNGDFDFPAAGMVAVAGANNTGKSALLSALDVVRGNYGIAGTLTQHSAATSRARIHTRFELTAEEYERLLERVEDQQRVAEVIPCPGWNGTSSKSTRPPCVQMRELAGRRITRAAHRSTPAGWPPGYRRHTALRS